MQIFSPHPALEPFIECYWSWEVASASGELDPILPDAAPELIIHLGQPPKTFRSPGTWERQPDAFLLCASQHAIRLMVDSPMRMFAIRFRPWGVSRFTNRSMAELVDREIRLDDVFSFFNADLLTRIRCAHDTEERVAIVDSTLRSAMSDQAQKDELIRKVHRYAAGGTAKGQNIATILGISERTFRRQWHDIVGLELRKFTSLMRFHRALAMIDAGDNLSLVASECGYADQPHLAREVRRISGLPASLLRKRLGADVYQDLYANRPAAPWTAN